MEQSPSWGAHLVTAFYVTEVSLPYSQQPATGPYPKPDESSPYFPNLFP
jgi:hypothetical protein